MNLKWYTYEDLELFNVLQHPVYMFDLENRCMYWANTSALRVWNADSLEELVGRNFQDMSESTLKRCREYMARLRKGEQFKEMWTIYPKGIPPVPIYGSFSGLHDHKGQLCLLVEVEMQETRDHIDQGALRSWEVLRHLPMAVSQHDSRGFAVEQNPEALHIFGGHRNCAQCTHATHGRDDQARCYLMHRFVQKHVGERIWHQVFHEGHDFSGEIQQRTRQGIRWFAVQLRRVKDPVTGNFIVLYSANDISVQVEAKLEAVASAHAAKEADEANMAKSEFVAVMAHEMRTPLHQVLGFVELLSQSQMTVQQKEYLELVETSASALMAVVNDLLDFTKLEAGKMKMELIPMDVNDVATQTFKVLESKGIQKGLSITQNNHNSNSNNNNNNNSDHHHHQTIPPVLGDPSRLRQILLNLLGNAIKFTQHGSVSLHVLRLPDDDQGRVVVEYAVEDTGIGIHPDHRELIFNKYQQADAAIARKYGGTGLGLAICKIIVETLGGQISVDSQLGKGSRFWFRIPHVRAPDVASGSHDSLLEEDCRALKVLVAEDNRVNQKLVVSVLRRLGHTSTVVGNGRLAVEAVEKDKYDVVLMDVQMPHMDGMEATQLIRENGWSRTDLPILGLTADFNRKNLGKFTNVGMNDCMGKPLKMKDLKAYLTIYAGRGRR